MIHDVTLYGSAALVVILFTGVIFTFTGYGK